MNLLLEFFIFHLSDDTIKFKIFSMVQLLFFIIPENGTHNCTALRNLVPSLQQVDPLFLLWHGKTLHTILSWQTLYVRYYKNVLLRCLYLSYLSRDGPIIQSKKLLLVSLMKLFACEWYNTRPFFNCTMNFKHNKCETFI